MKHLFFIYFFSTSVQFVIAQTNTQSDPVEIFDQLWNIFNEQYAGFESRNIDWQKVKNRYSPLVNPNSTPSELFQTCCSMLMELKDAHVSLVDKKENESKYCNSFGFPDSTSIYKRFKEPDAFYKMVDNTLALNGFDQPKESPQHVQYTSNGKIGYIRIYTMSQSYKGFEHALNMLDDTKGIILDLRLNPGGTDYFLHKIAGHFTANKIIGHYKSTRKKGTNEYSRQKSWMLTPSKGLIYLGPVIILTSNFTVSAAEVFTMTMKELPQVTTVGERTNGSMSHIARFTLENNWSGSLSNKRTFSAELINFEGLGILPDIEASYTDEDHANLVDGVLTKALATFEDSEN